MHQMMASEVRNRLSRVHQSDKWISASGRDIQIKFTSCIILLTRYRFETFLLLRI